MRHSKIERGNDVAARIDIPSSGITQCRENRARFTMGRMLTLRSAKPEDEDHVLRWRNEPSTRRWSLSQDEVSAEHHHIWFTQRLEDSGCILRIIEEDSRPVGQLRLERITPDLAEVSIGLAPEARGKGLGREALRIGTSDAATLLGVKTIRALVKRGNLSSLGAFRAAGFREVGETGSLIELQRPAEQ
jgi:RimJ/RimL family protein N-acetyltransferase